MVLVEKALEIKHQLLCLAFINDGETWEKVSMVHTRHLLVGTTTPDIEGHLYRIPRWRLLCPFLNGALG